MSFKTHGITTDTTSNMLLGAGVLYRNLTYTQGSGWTGTVLGATSGGIKFRYEPTWLEVEVDGATVAVKGITRQKIGESASLEGQMTELSPDLLQLAFHMDAQTAAEGDPEGYLRYATKTTVEGDYLENVAYVGTLSGGEPLIVILPNALCTEAIQMETKNATQNTYSVKFECTADCTADALNRLGVTIYFPDRDSVSVELGEGSAE